MKFPKTIIGEPRAGFAPGSTSQNSPPNNNSLADLAARIDAEHQAVTTFIRRGLQRAIVAGKLLLEAKAQLDHHGEWLPWLREPCRRVPERTARHNMRLARHADELTDEMIGKSRTQDTNSNAIALRAGGRALLPGRRRRGRQSHQHALIAIRFAAP